MDKNFDNLNPSYKYVANDEQSYDELVKFLVGRRGINLSLFPGDNTIIVTPGKEATDAIRPIGEYIDKKGLNFHIDPIEVDGYSPLFSESILDGATAKKMANIFLKECDADIFNLQKELKETKANLESMTKDRDNYQKWYRSSIVSESKIKEQIKAISVLMNAIYPD